MLIRKTYLLVRVPKSLPEKSEPAVKDSLLAKRKKEISEDFIFFDKKVNQNIVKIRVHEFPETKVSGDETKSSGRSCSIAKSSVSPVKLGKYVGSVLDSRKSSSQRSYKRKYYAMSCVKGKSRSPEKIMCIKSNIISMIRKRLGS